MANPSPSTRLNLLLEREMEEWRYMVLFGFSLLGLIYVTKAIFAPKSFSMKRSITNWGGGEGGERGKYPFVKKDAPEQCDKQNKS